MKKLKMLTSMEGPKTSIVRGDILPFEDEEAERLIKAGFAEAFDDAPAETDEEKLERLEKEAEAVRAGIEAKAKAKADADSTAEAEKAKAAAAEAEKAKAAAADAAKAKPKKA